jgi:superfamily II DNA or RNA helicase
MSTQQQFNYDLVESPYGPKLAVQFDYDAAIVAALKRLSWSGTHRAYNDPSDGDAILDYRCWTIDHTEDALAAFEAELGTAVPDDYWPGGSPSDGSAVRLVVPEGSSHFRAETQSDRAVSLLDAAFSYRVEDAEYVDAYQQGEWDGKEHLFETRFRRAPVGLLDQASTLLESEGYTVTVEREAPNTGRDITADWRFDHDLRPYQRASVQAMLDDDGGIVALPTGTGKTVVGLRFIHALESRALVLVHSRELLYQWADRIEATLGVEPGIIGDGEFSQGPITVATLQTLMAQGGSGAPAALDENYGIVFFDECHRTSAAEQMHEIGTSIDALYRVGLSATPWRRVGGETLKIEAAVGPVTHEVAPRQMIANGYLANPTFDVIDPMEYGEPRRANPNETYHAAKTRVIETDPARLTAIASKTRDLAAEGYQVLVNVSRKGHGRLLVSALNGTLTPNEVVAGIDTGEREQRLRECCQQLEPVADTDAELLTGDTSDAERERILDALDRGEQRIVVSTILSEGVDIPSLDAVVLAHGQRSDVEVIQTVGRALRPSGEREAMIVDVADRGQFFGEAYQDRRDAVTDYYGLEESPTVETTPVRAVA